MIHTALTGWDFDNRYILWRPDSKQLPVHVVQSHIPAEGGKGVQND
jgi:hypothetical protein